MRAPSVLLALALTLALPHSSLAQHTYLPTDVVEEGDAGHTQSTAQRTEIPCEEITMIHGSSYGEERDVDVYECTAHKSGILYVSTYGGDCDYTSPRWGVCGLMVFITEISSKRTEWLHEEAGSFYSRTKMSIRAGERYLIAIGPEWFVADLTGDEIRYLSEEGMTGPGNYEDGYHLPVYTRLVPQERTKVIPPRDIECASNAVDLNYRGALEKLDLIEGYMSAKTYHRLWFRVHHSGGLLGLHVEANYFVTVALLDGNRGLIEIKGWDDDDPINPDLGGVIHPRDLPEGIYYIGLKFGSDTSNYLIGTACFEKKRIGWLVQEGQVYLLITGGASSISGLVAHTTPAGGLEVSFSAETNRVSDFLVEVEDPSSTVVARDSVSAVWSSLKGEGVIPYTLTIPATEGHYYDNSYHIRVTPRVRGSYHDHVLLAEAATVVTDTEEGEVPTTAEYDLQVIGPNPTRGEVRVRVSTPTPTEITIEVYDLLGRVVVSKSLLTQTQEVALDLRHLPAGTYFLRANHPSIPTRSVTVVR